MCFCGASIESPLFPVSIRGNQVPHSRERGDAVLRKASLGAQDGEVTAPVNCGQELYDVIAVTDAVAGLSAAKRRVLGMELRYSAATGAYETRLRLGGV